MGTTKIDTKVMFTKGIARRVTTVTATYTATLEDDIIICAGAAPFTVTLPTAAAAFDTANNTSKVFTFINIDTDDATIDGDGSETINGSSTFVLDVQYEWVDVVSNGTAWFAKA